MVTRRWGLSLDLPGLSLADAAPVIKAAEDAGYTDGWPGEVSAHDGFTPVAVAAMATERMRVGTGVVNVFTRGPAVLAQHAAALAGERAGEGRFKLDLPPEQPVPIVIAALRERMLHTAGELGDGAFVNFLPLASVDKVLEQIRAGEREAGKDEGSTEVLSRFFCLQGDPEQTRGMARRMFCAYATVPVYERFFRWLGYGEDIDPMIEAWRGGDRGKALELAPGDLIEDIFVLGDAAEQRSRVEAFQDRGIDVPVLLVIPGGEVTPDGYGELVEALAPTR